jgi:hypothetical protein
MKKKYSLTLDDEFIKYCELNSIVDIEKYSKSVFDRGFTILKYGETPSLVKGHETIKEVIKEVVKEVVVEKIVEVPVEVIKEVRVEVPVEVIKEVPIKGDVKVVTKEVIKEIEVEKPIYITDNDEIQKLKELNKKLNEDLKKITDGLSNMGKAKFMKNSDLSSLYDE